MGFSYGPTTKTSDEETAAANLKFMLSFFTAYSEYQSNEFYITGESYAGVRPP